jgi:hypothetical protein
MNIYEIQKFDSLQCVVCSVISFAAVGLYLQ